MPQRKQPQSQPQNGLFPASWVVGEAAAELAKNDDGVLLAQPVDVGEAQVSGAPTPAIDEPDPEPVLEADPEPDPEPVPPPVELSATDALPADRGATLARELAELRVENERLRDQLSLARHPAPERVEISPEPLDVIVDESVGVPVDSNVADDSDVVAANVLMGDEWTVIERGGGRRPMRVLLLLLLVFGLGAGGWFGTRLAAHPGSLDQRFDAVQGETGEMLSSLSVDGIAGFARDALTHTRQLVDGWLAEFGLSQNAAESRDDEAPAATAANSE